MLWNLIWRKGICRRFLLCLFLYSTYFLSASSLSAETAKLTHYFQEHWTTADGLPHNTINGIRQSEDGYLWLATWEGAARFNGRTFKVFDRENLANLPDTGIRNLSQDRAGNLLVFGSRGGFARLTSSGWEGYKPFDALIKSVVEDAKGNFWLASEGNGLFKLNADGTRQHFLWNEGLSSDAIHHLFIDSQDILWIASGGGLYSLDTKTDTSNIQRFNHLPANSVFVLQEHDSHLLVGTDQGLFAIKEGKAALTDEKLAGVSISSVLVQDKDIWIGSTDRGLLRLSALGLEQLTIEDGLPNNRVLSLFLDKEQSLWVGTNGGLFRLRDAPFTTYTTENGLVGDYIRTVMQHSDGSMWVGSSQGVTRYINGVMHPLDLSGTIKGHSILSMTEASDGSVWIGTYTEGVLHVKDGKVIAHYSRNSGLLANEVRAILQVKNGDVWVGTALGLNLIKDNVIQHFTVHDGLPTSFIMALYEHIDGRLFIGTGEGVAVRTMEGKFEQLDFSNTDNAKHVFGFAYDKNDNALWITTDRGLVHYSFNNEKLSFIGRDAGMPFDKFFQAVIDNEKNIWLSSNRGILRFERRHLNAFLNGLATSISYEIFSEGDGLISAQANGGSMAAGALAQDGRVWFATSKGAGVVQPAVLKRFLTNTLPVVIESVKVNGESQPLKSELTLRAGTNRLEFTFAGLGFVMPQHILYRTRLIGFDEDWVDRGSQTIAEFTNLPPGEYRFMVSAAYPQGGWSVENAQISFTIKPYFWQTWVFWLALIGFGILLGYVVLRWRINLQKQREELLRKQVAAKTLELQNQADSLKRIAQERSALLDKLKIQSEEFAEQARRDPLTGLANRRAFDETLVRECARAKRNLEPLCLVLLDIDHFKRVNDTFNHSVGDEILKLVANEISRHCRTEDSVARWGGEEFAVLLPNTNVKQAQEICERLRFAIMQMDCSNVAPGLTITASMGIAEFAGESQYDKLLTRSDKALYRAKQNGRNQVEVAV